MSDKNIDKDIEIVKKFIEETQEEYSETLVDGKVYRIDNIPLEFKPTKELANSISNVLSELERLRLEEKRKDKMIDKMAQKLLNYDFMFIKSKHRIKEVFRNEVLENE